MATEPVYVTKDDEVPIKDQILVIRDWLNYLLSKWLFIFLAGLLGGVIGLWIAFRSTPTYSATTTFVVESGESGGGLRQFAGMAAMAGIDIGGNAGGLFQGDNIMELYKARKMITQTLLSKTYPDSSELLVERYIRSNGLLEAWEETPELLALDFRVDNSSLSQPALRLRDSVLNKFVNNIKEDMLIVDKPDRNLSIIRVNVISKDEVFAKVFNENLVKEVNDFYIQTKTKKSKNNIAILEEKVDSVKAVMERAIYSVAKVSDQTPNLNPTRQIQRLAPTQEAQFSAESNKAILSQLLQNLELSKMSLLQEQPLIQLVDQPVYPLPVTRLGKIKSIIIGGFLFGLLSISLLIGIRWYRQIMNEESDKG